MIGYKCFNKNLETNTGINLEIGKIYKIELPLKVKRAGFHFCKNLEDTLRYFNGLEEEIVICKIEALGEINEFYDDYNDYDIYSTNKIYIEKQLTREEIIDYVKGINEYRFIRFIQGFKLNQEELNYFYDKYKNNKRVIKHLKYYQEKDVNAFNPKTKIIIKN